MFKKVLVPLDASSLAEQAAGPAAAIARASDGEVGLVLAHQMLPYNGFLDASWRDAKSPEENKYIRQVAEELAKGASVTVNGCVETGKPADVIRRRAREIDADLIVMTSHGRTGLSRMWLGSVADEVMREASVPVLMLRPNDAEHPRRTATPLFRRILVPLDGSLTSSAILPVAGALAKLGDGTLILARVVIPVPLFVLEGGMPTYPTALVDEEATQQLADRVRDEIDTLARNVREEYGVAVETDVVVNDRAASALLEIARNKHAELIAMTTHGRGASRLFLGSVTDKVLRGGDLPLLLLHPHITRQDEREAPSHPERRRQSSSAEAPDSPAPVGSARSSDEDRSTPPP